MPSTVRKTNKRPRISLCIPNYNRAHDLLNVVRDCMNQTVEPYEIIIQDDRSNEEELKIIKKGLTLSRNMSFAVNKKNLGLAGNVNAVIKKAKGDYLAVVNNDDRISKYYVEEIEKAVLQYPRYNVYTTNGMGMNERGEVVGDYRLHTKNTVLRKRDGIRSMWNHYFFNLITISGTSFYRSSFIKKHLFNEKLGNESDLDNALNFLASEDIVYIDKPIYYVRMHADQESTKIRATSEKLDKYVARCMQIYSKYDRQFTAIPAYMTPVKSVYFFQLIYKYRYPLKKVKKLLRISSNTELVSIILTIPTFLAQYALKLLKFKLHYQLYTKYFP